MIPGLCSLFYLGRTSGGLSANASPSILNATGSGSITTPSATATPMGGTSPYTYAWEFVSGFNATINSPTSQSTTFSATVFSGDVYSGSYSCTVTDSISKHAVTNIITAQFRET